MFDGFKRGIVSVDGIDISYVTGGSGPPVLMLHGFPQSLGMWARVAPQLARHFTIVCADLRGYGATTLAEFDAEMLTEYRRAWRDPAMIHGACSDYRAAAGIDLAHDTADLDRKILTPTLALYGSNGAMAKLFDIPGEWRKGCTNLAEASVPGGHFFVDQFPDVTARTLQQFLTLHR